MRALITGGAGFISGRLVREAALAGLGLAFLPEPFIVDDVTSGRLIAVLEDCVTATTSASVVFADRDYIEPKVREFVDRAVEDLERAFAESVPTRVAE